MVVGIGQQGLVLAVGLHAEVVVEQGGDVHAEIGGIHEEQHLECLRVLHAEVPLLQGRHFLLEAVGQHAGDFFETEKLGVVGVDEADDDFLYDGDAQCDDVHCAQPLRNMVVA